jgi:uncharacterized membrane protein
MNLPPLTFKSGAIFLLGVAAVLFCLYLLISTLFYAQPHQRIPTDTTTSSPPAQ